MNQRELKKYIENSDIMYKLILKGKVFNVLIPKAQYNIIYIYAHIYNCFGSIQLISRCVIVGCDQKRKLQSIKNEYAHSILELNRTMCYF